MSGRTIEELIHAVQAAFDRPPNDVEPDLAVADAAVLQLRKACRLLAGGESLRHGSYHTLVIESSFVAIERSVEARLLERTWIEPTDSLNLQS